MRIRDATAADAADVAALLCELGYPTTAGEAADRLRRPDARVLLAESEGRVVGLAAIAVASQLHHAAPTARVTALVVSEAARGRGAGRRLMASAEELAREAGCHDIELTSGIRLEREAAHRFYEALGYERTSYRFHRRLGGGRC
jgi:GNAT superfamily N-acetyltransferase